MLGPEHRRRQRRLLRGVVTADQQAAIELEAAVVETHPIAAEALLLRGHLIGRPDVRDPSVPERGEVLDGAADAADVVVVDAGDVRPAGGRRPAAEDEPRAHPLEALRIAGDALLAPRRGRRRADEEDSADTLLGEGLDQR